jgi:hypothetical protein
MRARSWLVLVAVALACFAVGRLVRPGKSANDAATRSFTTANGARVNMTSTAPAVGKAPVVCHDDRYEERPPAEWQGMPIDRTITPPCESSERCGLARACINGVCTACHADSDCAAPEACVLGHCVLQTLLHCHSRSECCSDELCVLSGYSSDREATPP